MRDVACDSDVACDCDVACVVARGDAEWRCEGAGRGGGALRRMKAALGCGLKRQLVPVLHERIERLRGRQRWRR